jgi:trans-2,3-dihydro-3-hydroxyanthranilate isomerase
VFGWMQQNVPSERPFERAEELCAALGVTGSALPVIEYDNGMRHVFVVLESREAVQAVAPDFTRLSALTNAGVNVSAGASTSWKTRMFAPSAGVPEDAATGSAAGPLAVHAARHGKARFGEVLRITQGTELARPSELYAVAHGTAERVESVEVGGAAVVVGRGELRRP